MPQDDTTQGDAEGTMPDASERQQVVDDGGKQPTEVEVSPVTVVEVSPVNAVEKAEHGWGVLRQGRAEWKQFSWSDSRRP